MPHSSIANSMPSVPETFVPPMATTSSPSAMPFGVRVMGFRPASAAGLPGSMPDTRTPSTASRPFFRSCCEILSVTWSGASIMPKYGCLTWPYRRSCWTTRTTVSTGMAKPTPAKAPDGLAIMVFTPMRQPRALSNGPPLFPGLIAASVWMSPRIFRPLTPFISLPRPLTMPLVRVWSRPKGFPIARTRCPTRRLDELPRSSGVREAFALPFCTSRSTARSVSASMPMRVASQDVWSDSTTVARSASLMTWKFVTTCWSSQTKPDPVPWGTSCMFRW
mmetsp:Transcript_33688/g.104616  ORF Transcript_33688/g.104616 Transcript_33688/m.104616 type:complete len:277 (+) Transcript_33688:230-1060(+)